MHELFCDRCDSEISDQADICTTCGNSVGAPNVRLARKSEEKSALDERYNKVLEDAKLASAYDRLTLFDQKMKVTCAVVNVDISFLHACITNEKTLYTSYALGVKGQLRKPAQSDNDKERLAVEGILFGSYGQNIRYAALSLDGAGVQSYGKYSLKLREVTISHRATLLEDNSFVFVEKHELIPGKEIPRGRRSTWEDRHKLALAKLAHRVSPEASDAEYAGILLFSEGDYKTDNFIEIHIYGPFDAQAIEAVRGSSTSDDKVEAAMVENVKQHLQNGGKTWIEA